MLDKEVIGRLAAILAAAALQFCLAFPAMSDSWLPPKVQIYESPDGAWRLTVAPRGLTNQLEFFEDKVDGKEPAGQREGALRQPRGRFEQADGSEGWTKVWEAPLINDVAPTDALIADGGAWVVTFDNWHSVGWGDDVVVIYDNAGKLVRKLGLSDFLPEDYVTALPRSISSIWWGGEHHIDGDRLVLQVVASDEDRPGDRTYIEVVIDLPTGQPQAPSGPAWEAALVTAKVKAADIQREAEEWRTWFCEPLSPPKAATDDGYVWTRYLHEAFGRLTTRELRDDDGFIDTVFLPADGEVEARAKIREAFDGPFYEGYALMFGSPSQEAAAELLIAEARRVPRGKLKSVPVYILASDSLWPRLKAAFAPTGANLIQIDPDKPIPQRPERLRSAG